MGDSYVVLHHLKNRRKPWYTSVVVDLRDSRRVVCEGTPYLCVAKDYFAYVQTAQRDTLLGKNPYVTRDVAWVYKIASVCPYPFSWEKARHTFKWATDDILARVEALQNETRKT